MQALIAILAVALALFALAAAAAIRYLLHRLSLAEEEAKKWKAAYAKMRRALSAEQALHAWEHSQLMAFKKAAGQEAKK